MLCRTCSPGFEPTVDECKQWVLAAEGMYCPQNNKNLGTVSDVAECQERADADPECGDAMFTDGGAYCRCVLDGLECAPMVQSNIGLNDVYTKVCTHTGDQDGCRPCDHGYYSNDGTICQKCDKVERPNALSAATGCKACQSKEFGPDGVHCRDCLPGQEIDANRTGCHSCKLATALLPTSVDRVLSAAAIRSNGVVWNPLSSRIVLAWSFFFMAFALSVTER